LILPWSNSHAERARYLILPWSNSHAERARYLILPWPNSHAERARYSEGTSRPGGREVQLQDSAAGASDTIPKIVLIQRAASGGRGLLQNPERRHAAALQTAVGGHSGTGVL